MPASSKAIHPTQDSRNSRGIHCTTKLKAFEKSNPSDAKMWDKKQNPRMITHDNRNTNHFVKNGNHCSSFSGNGDKVHGPLNVSGKLKLSGSFRDVSEKYKSLELTEEDASALQLARSFQGYHCTLENRENFSFPEPPDLSATHLMPCLSKNQFYIQPYYPEVYLTDIYLL